MLERLFSSRARVKLLELFLLHPEREIHVREICRITGLNINAVRRELANLEGLRLQSARLHGYGRETDRADACHPDPRARQPMPRQRVPVGDMQHCGKLKGAVCEF